MKVPSSVTPARSEVIIILNRFSGPVFERSEFFAIRWLLRAGITLSR
jgi:hypothetical protein